MFENFTFETFAPHVGTEFHVRLPQGNLPLTLVSAQPGIQAMLTGQRRLGFSLIFRGPPQIYLPANSYDIAHPRLGLLKMMFICPVIAPVDPSTGRPVPGSHYEAIFN